MNMYSWSLLILVVTLAVLLVAAALLKPEPVPRVRVYRVPPRWPVHTELSDFPGDGEALWLESDLSDRRCASHDALDQFARHYQGLTR